MTFNEITKKAVQEAFQHPRDIDRNLVDAQQTRRVLDRIVGYQISPLLWDKVRRGLSAGRVQTVALRLIVEREREIKAFVKEEYWTIDAHLTRRASRRRSTRALSAWRREDSRSQRGRSQKDHRCAGESRLVGSHIEKKERRRSRRCRRLPPASSSRTPRASCASA